MFGDVRKRVVGGKYDLIRSIGEGAMGTVYEARTREGARVAIKMLAPRFTGDDKARRRLVEEGDTTSAVDHPRAVKVLDDGIDEDGSGYLVMELLEGASLATLAERRGGSLPESLVLEAAEGILDALEAAHAKGIIHRDVKPGNVFWIEGFGAKVLDFGVAASPRGGIRAIGTGAGPIVGTPGFMAPEQAVGDRFSVDARTDIWAVGATMFFLLTGRLVHEADNALSILERTATMSAPDIAGLVPSVSNATRKVVSKSLALRRTERFASAREMREAVSAALDELRATGPTAGSRRVGEGPTSPPSNKARRTVVVALLLLPVLLGAAATTKVLLDARP